MKKSELVDLLNSMSLTEKIQQLIQLNGDFYGENGAVTGPAAEFQLDEKYVYSIGSILSECGAEHLHEMQDKFMAAQPHHIPALFMADVIHGYRTAFPVPIALGASFEPELAEEISSAAAKEAAAAGLHVTFSPMADLVRDSRWGRVMESTGEDPLLNSRMVTGMIKGFQGNDYCSKGKLAACAKHFAAYGAVESGRDYNVTEISEHTLWEDYLPSYKAAVDAGVSMMMTAFNTIDRSPCTTNKKLMRDILRRSMGFDGVLITDYNAIGETINHGSSEDRKEAALKAIEAGCDIDMMSDCYIKCLEELVNEGTVDEKLIDEAVMRVLELKNRLGLFENPYKDGSAEDEKKYLFCREHQELSRKAAEKTTVLLKNNGILPLDISSKIAVIGTLADSRKITGTWALFVDENETVTLNEALKKLYPSTEIVCYPTDSLSEDMRSVIQNCDAVILALGEDQMGTGESRSKTDISLIPEQIKLFNDVLSLNKNIVTVLFGGRPLAVPYIAENSAALVEAWLPGSCGCYAVADIIFGNVNPSGKLSMSMPYCTGQLPISYSTFSTGRPKPPVDHFIPFVSNYMDAPNTPLYAFGHGLSYSNISYSDVTLDSSTMTHDSVITASVTIKNSSSLPCTETVQMYIRDMKGSVVRPMRMLKDFRKVSIPANSEVEVKFEINEEMLRFYNIDMEYVSEKGDFMVWIGTDSTTENGAAFRLEK